MTNRTADRIKLAEWMGWTQISEVNGEVGDRGRYTGLMGISPDQGKNTEWNNDKNTLPDPFADANDCEAVMQSFREKGFAWTIECWPDGDSVSLYSNAEKIADAENVGHYEGGVSSTGRDNWKTGVCELALKVIGERE